MGCRVIASQAAVPLIYVPLEAVASKWYGESERNLAEIFRAAEQLGGAIIFLDEVDSLATQRRCTSPPAADCMLPLMGLPCCVRCVSQRLSCQQLTWRHVVYRARPIASVQALAAC